MMLKVSKAERAHYPKPCDWCGLDVKYGPFTYGKVDLNDSHSCMLHGDKDDKDSCAYKFVQGQRPLPVEQVTVRDFVQGRVGSLPTMVPSGSVEAKRVLVRDPDPASVDYLILEPAELDKLIERIGVLEASVNNMIHALELSNHPANEVE